MLGADSLLNSVTSIHPDNTLKIESGNVCRDNLTIEKVNLPRTDLARPSMYKIDEWKNYRNQVGLTRIRHENKEKHSRNQSIGTVPRGS